MTRPHRYGMAALVLLAATVSVIGLSGSRPALGAAPTVTLAGGATPQQVETTVGGTVTFDNRGEERRRMRARDPEDVDTSDIEPGSSATVSFPIAGTYRFVEERSDDPAFAVTVRVVAPAASPPADREPSGSTRGPSSPSDGSSPSTAEVSIPSRSFSPASVSVAVGGTVTWVNRDGDHTVTAQDGSFDSGVFDEGGRFEQTFESAGTYEYLCVLHPEMTGRVIVGAAGSDAGSRAAPETRRDAGGGIGESRTPAEPGPAGASTLEIVDLAFTPESAAVPAGTTVTWVNRGELPHTVTSEGDGPLGSDVLATGDRYRFTFDEPGTYDYLCALHPEMTGSVTVTAAGDGVEEAPPPPSDPPASGSTPSASEPVSTSAAGVGADSVREAGDDDLPEIAGLLLAVMAVAFVIGRSRRSG